MIPSLLYNAGNNGQRPHSSPAETRRREITGTWSESTETLNETDNKSTSPFVPSILRSTLDDQFFPSLAADPGDRVILTFEADKRRKTTRLTRNGQAMYTFASLAENASSSAGCFTQLRDQEGKILATHISSSETKQMVKLGDAAPIPRKSWLSDCGVLSFNCGKFQHNDRWFKWRSLNASGRASVVLRDHSIKSAPVVARFVSIHRIESASLVGGNQRALPRSCSSTRLRSQENRVKSWRATLELNPEYRDVWDYAIFSLVVLESLKGGRTVPPLEYEDETGTNVSYLANLVGLFAGTA